MRKPLLTATAILLPLIGIASPGSAKKAPKPGWQVSRTSDPITGVSSCIVAAYDQAARMSYTRTGALYPFVENCSVHGVLVGVGSGGRFRLPTGDIVWRVDDRPFRTLAAADNPPGVTSPAMPQANTLQASAAMQQLVDQQMRIVAAATATSTVAGGDAARTMLAEMLGGKGLVFRAAAATTSYGLPNGADRSVGQISKVGLRPYPLDDSFRAGLTACGVATSAATGSD